MDLSNTDFLLRFFSLVMFLATTSSQVHVFSIFFCHIFAHTPFFLNLWSIFFISSSYVSFLSVAVVDKSAFLFFLFALVATQSPLHHFYSTNSIYIHIQAHHWSLLFVDLHNSSNFRIMYVCVCLGIWPYSYTALIYVSVLVYICTHVYSYMWSRKLSLYQIYFSLFICSTTD